MRLKLHSVLLLHKTNLHSRVGNQTVRHLDSDGGLL